jgi:ketosteroid isomerase-like protein
MKDIAANEGAIRDLLEQWAAAVRTKDLPAILAHHLAGLPDVRCAAALRVARAQGI